jgi:putative SOS response-associated peptidase YedK
MCGRYVLSSPIEAIETQFAAEAVSGDGAARPGVWLQPRYNLAPSAAVPVVSLDRLRRIITLHQWGLVPSWARDPALGGRLANARAETVAEKPSFRGPFRRSRCIIPATAFYEWQARPGQAKQPYCIRAAEGILLAFAGLRSRWEGPDGALDTCTIITTSANGVMAPIHDRMPVILAAGDYAAWLDPDAAPARLQALLRPCPEAFLQAYPVGPRVGNARTEGPELMAPLDGQGPLL